MYKPRYGLNGYLKIIVYVENLVKYMLVNYFLKFKLMFNFLFVFISGLLIFGYKLFWLFFKNKCFY